MKNYKAIDILWATSLIVIAIVSIIWAITSVVGYTLPMALARTFGVLDIVSIVVLACTTVRKIIENKRSKNNKE